MKAMERNKAYFTLVLTFFCWGSIYVASRLISDEVPPGIVAAMRCLIAVVPLMFMARKDFGVKIQRADWKYFFAVGGFGYFATIFLVQEGIARTGASMASLINSLTPVGVTICAAFLLKEPITRIKVLCLVLALAGTYIITSDSQSQGEVVGVLLCLLSVLCWSITSVFMKRLTAQYSPIMVTAYGIAISLVFHVPNAVYTAVVNGGTGLTPKALVVLLYLGLIGSGFSQYTWTKSLSKIPASTCSLFYPLQPVFSALLGALILGERFRVTFFIGMALIAADVILSARDTAKQLQKDEAQSSKAE